MTTIDTAADAIDADLPEMARRVIRLYLDPDDPQTADFLAHPDGRDQHQMHWHQWGILTHTRVFLRHFREDIPRLLAEWGLRVSVDSHLAVPVDGVSKADLLTVSILLHDIGKFAARRGGRGGFHFAGHERLSGTIIRSDLRLEGFGLSPSQIDYIAMTAEDHFVLGLLRRDARSHHRYDAAYAQSPDFTAAASNIKRDHPDDYTEVGILFLGDSLAKVDPESGPPKAVAQHQINIAIARRYLEIVMTP